jgi:Activator of Hsp90 ATPase homolog 1-like protein
MTTQLRSYTTAFVVDRPGQQVFNAINDVSGWWSEEVAGVTDRVGGEFDYHYQDAHRCTLRVTQLTPGRTVAWHVVDNHFNFVEDQDEWKDTDSVFDITENADGTEVRFTHDGLDPRFECYDVCSNAWSGYVHGSLRDLILTGQGQPNPKAGGTPEHQDAANQRRLERS